MAAILFIFSVLAFLAGMGVFAESKSVLHEMMAGILFIISAIFLTGAFVVNAIDSSKKMLSQILDELKKLRFIGAKIRKYQEKNPDDRA